MLLPKLILFFITLILISFGFVLDCGILLNAIFFNIDSEFIYYIYAALATIAALSATILTVIANSLSDKHMGFHIREIVTFQNQYFKISQSIPVALFSIILGTLLLSLNYVNTLCSLLIVIVIMIVSMSSYIWEIISRDIFCSDLVKNEIERVIDSKDDNKTSIIFDHLFDWTISKLVAGDYKSATSAYAFISDSIGNKQLTKEQKNGLNVLQKKLFVVANEKMGLIQGINFMYDFIIKLDPEYGLYSLRELMEKPLLRIRYMNDYELGSNAGILAPIDSGEMKIFNEEDSIYILYNYFKNAYLNEIVSPKVRKEVLANQIDRLLSYTWSTPDSYDIAKHKTLLHIFKDYVLVNKSYEDAQFVLSEITKKLYAGRYTDNRLLFKTYAMIYTSMYFYIEYEVDSLTKEHIAKLTEMMQQKDTKDIFIEKSSLQAVIREFFKEIVNGIWNTIPNFQKEYGYLENWGPNMRSKQIIFYEDNILDFAFRNYLLSYYSFVLPPMKMITDWETVPNQGKVISKFLSFFDREKKRVDADQVKRLQALSEWVGIGTSLDSTFQTELCNKLEEQMRLVVTTQIENTPELILTMEEMNSKLISELREIQPFGYNENYVCNEPENIKFNQWILEKEDSQNTQYIIRRMVTHINEYLNWYIKNEFKEQIIGFDEEDVTMMSKILAEGNYNLRNYTYVDDWGFKKEIRESDIFQKLVEQVKLMKMEDTNPIRHRMFFDKKAIEYRFEVSEYTTAYLSDEECSSLAESFRISDGLYSIRNVRFTKSEAMDAIVKGYVKVSISLNFFAKKTEGKGIRIVTTVER